MLRRENSKKVNPEESSLLRIFAAHQQASAASCACAASLCKSEHRSTHRKQEALFARRPSTFRIRQCLTLS